MISHDKANWMGARTACKSLNNEKFDLTSIMSAAEQRFISSSLNIHFLNYTAGTGTWVGLNSTRFEGGNLSWSWSDGLPFKFGSNFDKFPWTDDPRYRVTDKVSNKIHAWFKGKIIKHNGMRSM